MAWTPSCDTPEPFELSDTITGAPNVVFEVCVWAPQGVTKQCPAIPGVWGHCPQCPIVTLAAEGDLSTIIRHPNGAAQFEPTVGYGVGDAECGLGGVYVAPKGDLAVPHHPWDVGALPPMPHGNPSC